MSKAKKNTGGEASALSLEQRIERLREILGAMEGDEVDLEQSLALFEEGIMHVRAAEAVLRETELRVDELLDADGTTRPLDGGGGE